MPIIFWVTVYVESITGSAKKTVTCQHVDRTGTLHALNMSVQYQWELFIPAKYYTDGICFISIVNIGVDASDVF